MSNRFGQNAYHGRTKNTPMHTISVVPKALQRVADGYVDEQIVEVRRLLREGKGGAEIAEACGFSDEFTARNYIRRNGLSLTSRGKGGRAVDTSWYAEALELRRKRMKGREIADALGKTIHQVNSLFSRVDNGLADAEGQPIERVLARVQSTRAGAPA